MAGPLDIHGRFKEIKGRQVVIETTALVAGIATARGEMAALQMPHHFGAEGVWSALDLTKKRTFQNQICLFRLSAVRKKL